MATWNLLTEHDGGAPPWAERVEVLARHVGALAPAVLATQEGSAAMLDDLVGRLPGHRWVGEGRRGRGRDECTALVYDAAALTVLDVRHRWLSPTPLVPGSVAPGADLPRMLTTVHLHHAGSGARFVVVGTHLDHVGEAARDLGAALVAEELGGGPTVVLGDFNAAAGRSAPYGRLVGAGLVDALAPREREEQRRATFVGVPGRDGADEGQIDWLLVTPGIEVVRGWVDEGPTEGFGSDHRPVVADLRLPS
ncbi:endonuclease/exonuclease/phosphatase family metal-dependent hydrolase [Lapillicoccus jejuensis]|uniref:Endonuclease/exonuclease/phosphatase family metal-dependent hydrolase n=1 Tax=Lapillicoccus jejuensis TaxID=402171 RepID=A0A542E151_9MICO|nr:endonuclease/exonuclease/phosphatase family metal-dependent hydrolase [Lapillicoccus jejuensis]